MKNPVSNAGTIQALLERLNTQRPPRALRMREKVGIMARMISRFSS